MTVIMTLKNPLDKNQKLDIFIKPNNTQLATDWQVALSKELDKQSYLEKNFCWLGWPDTARTLDYLCNQLNRHIDTINSSNIEYYIDLVVAPQYVEVVNHGGVNHNIMNVIHNHFEILQGTVNNLSDYYKKADPLTKYSIRQLNNLCHEIESLCLSLRKKYHNPEWVRPSQITTFLNATRYKLNPEHRKGFLTNGYDRKFARVYMHWAQIGKTLYEVFRDEHGTDIDQAVCDAITHLEYYSGEFDIEWGKDIIYGVHPWHTNQIDQFTKWLVRNGYDPNDASLSLGYLEIASIDLVRSFNTTDVGKIWDIMSNMLDIYSIQCGNSIAYYDYNWTDEQFEQQQLEKLRQGYSSNVR